MCVCAMATQGHLHENEAALVCLSASASMVQYHDLSLLA